MCDSNGIRELQVSLKINFYSRIDLERAVSEPEKFLERIRTPEAIVVSQFYPRDEILALRRDVFQRCLGTNPSWHPLLEGCPDYHRLHDNYPGAHVKSKMHGFYFHGWYEHNAKLFSYFRDIFELKCLLGQMELDHYWLNTPRQGFVARLNLQNYPRGGGYLAEHVDPDSRFALIQTLVQGTEYDQDFHSGGLFARAHLEGEKVYLDPHTRPGDLMILSPAVPHGVDPVDPEEVYDWRTNAGKWTVLPLFVESDVRHNVQRPREVNAR